MNTNIVENPEKYIMPTKVTSQKEALRIYPKKGNKMQDIDKISSFVKEALKALSEQNAKKPKYIYVSHIYRDTLKKSNQLEEITKLEKAWGVKIVFT